MMGRFAATFARWWWGITIGTLATGLLVAQQPAQPAQPAGGRGSFGAPAGRADRRGSSRLSSRRTSTRKRAASRCACTPSTRLASVRAPSTAQSTNCTSVSARRKSRSSRSTAPKIGGVWQPLDNPDTLVWMLAYRDRAHRDDVWAKFAGHPDWKALSSNYSVPIGANVFMMSATDYSPLQ